MHELKGNMNFDVERIMVTGANGFVGQSLCKALCRQRYAVVAALRSESTMLVGVERVILGALDSSTDWTIALVNVDVVVHLAARVHIMNDTTLDPMTEFRKVNVDSTLNLARQAAQAGAKRFIFISSIKVNGESTSTGRPFTEDDVANPQDPYGVSKWEAERGLQLIAQQTGMEVIIIRPPLVYGPGVKANFASMMNIVKRKLPLPLGAIHNQRSFVYVGNLVSFIMRCIEHPAAVNQVFLVSDGHDLSTSELLQMCAKTLNVKLVLLPVPQKLIKFGTLLFGKRDMAQRLCGNLQVDITKAQKVLGWFPPITVEAGLNATAIDLFKIGKE